MTYWRKVFAITRKDILSEFRAREIIVSVLMFVLLVIIIFNFAFGSAPGVMNAAAAGMLWVTFTFAGVLSLNRSFIIEKEEGCLEGLMVAPISRDIIYAGKMLSSLIFLLVVEIIALPIFAFLFNLNVLTIEIITVTLLATLGFVSCGTLFSALAVKTKARELVLPILFLPIVVPVILGAVKATGLVLEGQSWNAIRDWLLVMGAFDIIFFIVSFWIFSFVIEE
jgi:heme exporter protein B